MSIDLPPLRVGHRARLVRGALAETGCEALLVTGLPNVRWLTGFTGSAGRVLVLPDRMMLVTDGRYGDQARAQLLAAAADADVVVGANILTQNEVLATATSGVAKLGLEAAHVTWADLATYQVAFSPGLVATTGLVERHRVLKDAAEVARIEAAADIADAALANVAPLLDAELLETEFALALDTEMRRLGASGPSFETIVASGPNAALPHHRPSERRIIAGDSVVIDFGALVDGYHSDMTRTALVGDVDDRLREIYEVVVAAQAAGVAAVRP
ncbi:MAG TPA: M24 family metallopeptidase, partial [Acidimicrobiales bacterium]